MLFSGKEKDEGLVPSSDGRTKIVVEMLSAVVAAAAAAARRDDNNTAAARAMRQ